MTSAELFWLGMMCPAIIMLIGGLVAYYLGIKKKINSYIGFRLPSILNNPKVLEWGNKIGGLILAILGASLLFSMLIFRDIFLSNQLYLLYFAIGIVALAVISEIIIAMKASNMAKK